MQAEAVYYGEPRPRARFASFGERANAGYLDALVYIAGIAIFAPAIPQALPGEQFLRIALLFGVPLLMEPVLQRCFGRTLGQRAFGLYVVPISRVRPPGLVMLTLRYWLKLALGAASFYYMEFSGSRQALHDRLARTVVLRVPSGSVPPAVASASLRDPPDSALPSAWRRFFAFVFWEVVLSLVLVVVIGVPALLLQRVLQRTMSEDQARFYANIVLSVCEIALSVTLVDLGAQGRLLGARRRRTQS